MLFSDIVNQHYETLNEVDIQMVKYIHAHPKEVTTMGTMILRRFVIHQNPP